MNYSDKSHRHVLILTELLSGHKKNVYYYASKLGTSSQTIHRDLKEMRLRGVNVRIKNLNVTLKDKATFYHFKNLLPYNQKVWQTIFELYGSK